MSAQEWAQDWIQARADELGAAFKDEDAMLRRLTEVVAKRFPDRIGKSLWINVEGATDKGLSLRVYERKVNSLDILFGTKSIGAAALHRVKAGGSLLPRARVELSVGLGGAYWTDHGNWTPIAVVSVRF